MLLLYLDTGCIETEQISVTTTYLSITKLQVMVNLHLAPFPKPISSLADDYPLEQNHKGWQVSPPSSLLPFKTAFIVELSMSISGAYLRNPNIVNSSCRWKRIVNEPIEA